MTDNSRTRERLLALAAVADDMDYSDLIAQAAIVTGMDRESKVLGEALDDLRHSVEDQTDLQGDPGRAASFLDDGDEWADPLPAAEAELDRRISDALRRLGA